MRKIPLLLTALLSLATLISCEKTHFWDRKDYGGAKLTIKDITVHRSATCGCCKDWILHLQKHGFQVKDVVESDMNAVKEKLGVPRHLSSCHTAVIGDYVIEGHVPAHDIIKLLDEKPSFHGLTVPQMPVGTPGMETKDNKQRDKFNVIAFKKSGEYKIHNTYEDY